MARKQKSSGPEYNNPVATHLRELLVNNNYTQKHLSELLGITPQSVGAYCDGSAIPSLENLLKIADIFNVSLDYLTGHEVKKPVDNSRESFYENLCEIYFNGIITWMNDFRFSESERTVIKMHFSDLLLRYKQLVEFTAEWSAHSAVYATQMDFAKSAAQRLDDLYRWIEAFPMWYEKTRTDDNAELLNIL